MPSAKHNLTIDKATDLPFSLFNVASILHVQPSTVAMTHASWIYLCASLYLGSIDLQYDVIISVR